MTRRFSTSAARQAHKYPMKSQMKRKPYDAAILLLRLGAGLLLCFGHGVQKYHLLFSAAGSFPDPLGIGHVPSVVASMGAECGASMLVAVGLFTRWACLPVLLTMGVVAVVVHAGDPWSKTEPSVIFLLMFAVIALTGPGRFSLDKLLRNKT
jgi:putative oxidoreductase